MFKSRLIISTVAMMQFASVLAQAQAVPAVTPILDTRSSNDVIIGGPGNYNYNRISQDNTAIALKLLEQVQGLQKQDRDYLLEVSNRLNGHLKDLISLQFQLLALSQKSYTSPVDLQEILRLGNVLREKDQVLSVDLATNTIITRDSLPSYSPIGVQSNPVDVPSGANINFTALTQRIDALRMKIYNESNALQFKLVVTPNGQPLSITANALNPDINGIYSLTPAQIQDLVNQVTELRTPTKATRDVGGRYVDLSVTLLNQFVNNYAKTEWMRFTNDNDGKALKEAYKQIIDVFYYRSYIRKKYGIRIGALQPVNYNKIVINLENFGIQPLKMALTSFRREAAETQPDVLQAFESARNFVELYDAKITPVFAKRADILKNKDKSLEYSSQDTSFIVRANSAITWLTGQRRTSEVLLMLMRLVLSDIREEMMLIEGNRLAMGSYHDAKYRSTPETKLDANQKICRTDWTLPAQVFQAQCPAIGIKTPARPAVGMGGRSVPEMVSQLLSQIDLVENARSQDAESKLLLIQMARGSMSQQTNDELNDLFK